VKTAISMPEPLFRRIEHLAHELNVSRSQLISQAAEEFLRRHGARDMIERINASLPANSPDQTDQMLLDSAASRLADLTRDDQW